MNYDDLTYLVYDSAGQLIAACYFAVDAAKLAGGFVKGQVRTVDGHVLWNEESEDFRSTDDPCSASEMIRSRLENIEAAA